MKKYRLLIYQSISQRFRGILLWLVVLVGGLAIYDLINPFWGDRWYMMWLVWPAVFILWFYYAVLMRRAAIQIKPDIIRLQGPLFGLNISYGRIRTVTSTMLRQHFPYDEQSGYERRIAEPLAGQTCVMVELASLPKRYQWRRWWFPRFFFSPLRPGLLLLVEDWLAVSQDIDTARLAWFNRRDPRQQEDRRSLATRILDPNAD